MGSHLAFSLYLFFYTAGLEFSPVLAMKSQDVSPSRAGAEEGQVMGESASDSEDSSLQDWLKGLGFRV